MKNSFFWLYVDMLLHPEQRAIHLNQILKARLLINNCSRPCDERAAQPQTVQMSLVLMRNSFLSVWRNVTLRRPHPSQVQSLSSVARIKVESLGASVSVCHFFYCASQHRRDFCPQMNEPPAPSFSLLILIWVYPEIWLNPLGSFILIWLRINNLLERQKVHFFLSDKGFGGMRTGSLTNPPPKSLDWHWCVITRSFRPQTTTNPAGLTSNLVGETNKSLNSSLESPCSQVGTYLGVVSTLWRHMWAWLQVLKKQEQ